VKSGPRTRRGGVPLGHCPQIRVSKPPPPSAGQVERVNETLRFTIPEVCIALTVFREELSLRILGLFLGLLVSKFFHVVADERLNHVGVEPRCRRSYILFRVVVGSCYPVAAVVGGVAGLARLPLLSASRPMSSATLRALPPERCHVHLAARGQRRGLAHAPGPRPPGRTAGWPHVCRRDVRGRLLRGAGRAREC
jgi:hypothetical protein